LTPGKEALDGAPSTLRWMPRTSALSSMPPRVHPNRASSNLPPAPTRPQSTLTPTPTPTPRPRPQRTRQGAHSGTPGAPAPVARKTKSHARAPSQAPPPLASSGQTSQASATIVPRASHKLTHPRALPGPRPAARSAPRSNPAACSNRCTVLRSARWRGSRVALDCSVLARAEFVIAPGDGGVHRRRQGPPYRGRGAPPRNRVRFRSWTMVAPGQFGMHGRPLQVCVYTARKDDGPMHTACTAATGLLPLARRGAQRRGRGRGRGGGM